MRDSDWRRGATRVLMAAFILRALIPVGYMPDLGLLSKGILKVVICSGSGSKAILLDDTGKPVPAKSAAKYDQVCAFTGLAGVTSPTIDHSPIARDFEVNPLIKSAETVLPPVRAGPILGSRGPPQLSRNLFWVKRNRIAPDFVFRSARQCPQLIWTMRRASPVVACCAPHTECRSPVMQMA